MKKRKLRNLEASAIGLGCMGFSHGYGEIPSEEESISIIRKAFEEGCNFFDTAEGYGNGHNERLVGAALKPIRDKVVIATKFRVTPEEIEKSKTLLEAIRKHLNKSLSNLDTNYIDLYYLHRVNPNVSVEDIAECMSVFYNEGLIKGWGISQPTEDYIRKANAIFPLSAVQSEYSMMERMFEKDVIPTCQELGIGFVPFSPLASGFLSGKIKSNDSYSGDDVRRVITRFDASNVDANQPLLEMLHKYAEDKNATAAQISLSWMLHKYNNLVPIPGSKRLDRIIENFKAADVELSNEKFNNIEIELSKIEIYGNRTDEDIVKLKEMK